MKKLISFFAVALFLSIALAANASMVGTGDLDVTWSGPMVGNYYGDYDGQVVSSNFGYTTGVEEVFCVSKDDGNGGLYDFYTITSDLTNYATLSKAAWIADNWTRWGSDDATKVEAQKAVWQIMGVMNEVGTSGTDYAIYLAANNISNYTTERWYYALSPSSTAPTGTNYQDFLTPVTPTPIPTALWLLGTGLLGLVGLRRKFKA